MLSRGRLLSAGVAGLALAGAPQAEEVRFDYVTSRAQGQEISRQKFRIDDNFVSVSVDPNSAYLYSIEEKRLFLLNYAGRSYFEASGNMLSTLNAHLVKQREKIERILKNQLSREEGRIRATLEQALAQLDGVMANAEAARAQVSQHAEAEALGSWDTVGGHRCEYYLVRLGAGTGRACYAELPAFGAFSEALSQALLASSAIETMSGVGSPMTAVPGHFPVLTAFGLDGQAAMTVSLENLRLEVKVESPLNLPKDFVEQRLDGSASRAPAMAVERGTDSDTLE